MPGAAQRAAMSAVALPSAGPAVQLPASVVVLIQPEGRHANRYLEGFYCAAAASDFVFPLGPAARRSAAAAAPRRQVTRMMPIGVPRVPYRTPKARLSWA